MIAVILLAALAVTGVLLWPEDNADSPQSSSLSISLEKTIPPAYIREPYDLRQILRMEDGVAYSATAYYQNYDTMQEYEIPVTDLIFCQEENFDVYVLITAKRGSETAQKSIRIPLEIRADAIDDMLKSGGISSWSDDVIKTLNTDPQYIKGENSQTSLSVSFNGTNDERWGAIFLSLAGENIYPHLTDQIWENAVVTFWAYNPMPEPFEFQIYYADSITQVWVDWSSENSDRVVRAYAEPGQWTQIKLPLRKIGISRPFNKVKDTLAVRIRYNGHPGTETAYSYSLYVDGVDVVDASYFPDLDTRPVRSIEDISLGWENMSVASSGSYDAYYDTDVHCAEESSCSLHAAFKKQGSEFWPSVTLEPYLDARFYGKLPDLTSGTITTYFQFKNLVPQVRMKLTAEGADEWVYSQYVPMTLEPAGNDWYKGTVNVSDFELVNNRNDQIVRIEFEFPHAKDGSEVWIDRMLFTPSDAGKVKESSSADWINLPVDNSWYSGHYKYSTSYLKGSGSKRSVQLIAPPNEEGQIVFDFKAGVKHGKLSRLPGMTKGTLEAYFYFGDQEPMATAFVYNSQDQYADTNFYFESVGDGWYKGTVTANQMTGFAKGDASQLFCLGIRIPAGYTVYMDTLTYDAGRNLEWTFNPDDLFNTGAFSVTGVKQGVAGYKVVTDETNGSEDALYFWTEAKADWPMVHVTFPTPVDLSAYNTLRLDGKLGYGHNWVGIGVNYLDENGNIQHSGNYGNLSGAGWDSFTFSFTQFAGVNWSQVTSITVGINQCDFVEGAVNEHWLDNLCVYTETPDQNDLFADAVVEWGAFHRGSAFGGVEGYSYDNASTEVFGEDSVRSWKFTIEAGKGGNHGTVQMKLAEPVDATGKKLVFDLKLVDFRNWIGLSLADSGWQEIGYWANDLEDTTEWQTVTVDLSQLTGGDLSKLFLITLHPADDSAKAYEQAFYVDNVRLVDADEPTEPTEPSEPTEPEPTEPTEPDTDQNDLFTDAVVEWGAFHSNEGNGGKDGYSSEICTDTVNGDSSIQSWKYTIAAGKGGKHGTAQMKLAQPVDAAGKKLVFDLKLVEFRNWIGLSLADSGWQEIGYWANDLEDTTEWQTVTVDLSQMTGGDLSKLFLITLHPADDSAKTNDQVFYVDNVRLVGTANQIEDLTDIVTLTSLGTDYTAAHKSIDGDNNVMAFTVAASSVSDWPAMVAALPANVSLGKHYLKFDLLTASAFKELYLTVLDENGNRIIQDLLIRELSNAVGKWQSFTVDMLAQGLSQAQIDAIASIRFGFYVNPSEARQGDALYVDNLKLN